MIHSETGGYLESALTREKASRETANRETASRETAHSAVQVSCCLRFSTGILFNIFNHAQTLYNI